MNQPRLTRLRAAMKAAALDALLVSNPKNARYITDLHLAGYDFVQPFNDPETFVVVQPDRCDALCDGRYITGVRQHAGVTAQQLETPVNPESIAKKLREILNPGAAVIGIEHDSLIHSDAVGLQAAMPGITWKSADDLTRKLRLIKDPQECDKLRKAQALTAQAFTHIIQYVRLGMSERQVALELDRHIREISEGNSFTPIVAFGETSCQPHYTPSDQRKLQKGQLILMDFGAVYEGYHGDLTRMMVAGKADARQREVYDTVLAGQQRCLDGIRPGITGEQADALARDYFASKGCADQFLHGTGHGVGLAIHEAPRVRKTITDKLLPGMVFTVEPGLYYEDWGGVRIEDVVIVTETACENITPAPKTLVELPV